MAETRDRILDEATALFLSSGYTAASLRMIADRIGITQAAVYYHFRAKDDLLAALLTPLTETLTSVLAEAEDRMAAEGSADRRALLGDVQETVAKFRDAARLIRGDLRVRNHPAYADQLSELTARLAALLGGDPGGVLARCAIGVAVAPTLDDAGPGACELALDAAVRVLDTPVRERHRALA